MGVPKFYRWISERYPMINQVVSDASLIPEFDNLYLDMNGILHGCTHPNDGYLSPKLSERDIFLSIFQYIDRIVTHIVRPQKFLFMAIDGVAPRAKMNQQRSRRFRSSKDAAEERERVILKGGQDIDQSNIFDSNCITPGTEFMAKVSEHLKFFIRQKIKEDPLWQQLSIIFSGHEVPGEGEHKIMQYIRDQRHNNAFPPNTRHCMYGQDADLILLGLVSHEPHFTLLREVVNFGGNSNAAKNSVKIVMKTADEAKFQLMHLSVLREYLWIEFTLGIPPQLASKMSLEYVVDDFVFITFLIGNDFLPHMPSLDISEEAFDMLFGIYRTLFVKWDGKYLTKCGEILCPDRLEDFFSTIGTREEKILLCRKEKEEKYNRQSKGNSNVNGNHHQIAGQNYQLNLPRTGEEAISSNMSSTNIINEPNHEDLKGRYYFEKFGFLPTDYEQHQNLRLQYIMGLQWCLAYYYRGCISWSWFFPYHYVPMLSDLTNIKSIFTKVVFTLSKPFLPFEQLLGCLPANSAWCLPHSYAALMTRPDSPIADFYPKDFKIDMNGKRNAWEAVVLLPFIDSERLFQAVRKFCPDSKLTSKQKIRNSYGNVYHYSYCESETSHIASCNPSIGLRDIICCRSTEKILAWSIESMTSLKSAIPASTQIPYPGFPSLNVLPIHQAEVKTIPINVFGSDSKYSTLTLSLRTPTNLPTASQLAQRVIGCSIFVNWPMSHEAKITGISDISQEFKLSSDGQISVKTFDDDEAVQWQQITKLEQDAYMKGRKVPGSGGVDVGDIKLRLTVKPLQGMRTDPKTGSKTKVFGIEEVDVPLHMALWRSPAPDYRFTENAAPSLHERFPLGCKVICLTDTDHSLGNLRGCTGVVKAINANKVDVLVDLRPPEPPFGIAVAETIKDHYFPPYMACKKLNVRPDLFGKIVGSIRVDPGRYDIGLNLKANGRYQLLGYSRCKLRENNVWSCADTVRIVGSATEETAETEVESWEYTEEAIRLVAIYMNRYPQLFAALKSLNHERSYHVTSLFGPESGESTLNEVKSWLESLPTAGLPRLPLTSTALSKEAVKALESAAQARQSVIRRENRIVKRLVTGLHPCHLLQANITKVTDAPIPQEKYPELGDRIVNLCATGVPFGLWGTVIACHYHTACIEVVFDEEFMGGGTLQGMCSNYRGIILSWTTVASLHTADQVAASKKYNKVVNQKSMYNNKNGSTAKEIVHEKSQVLYAQSKTNSSQGSEFAVTDSFSGGMKILSKDKIENKITGQNAILGSTTISNIAADRNEETQRDGTAKVNWHKSSVQTVHATQLSEIKEKSLKDLLGIKGKYEETPSNKNELYGTSNIYANNVQESTSRILRKDETVLKSLLGITNISNSVSHSSKDSASQKTENDLKNILKIEGTTGTVTASIMLSTLDLNATSFDPTSAKQQTVHAADVNETDLTNVHVENGTIKSKSSSTRKLRAANWVQAQGPDESRGFPAGRGKPLCMPLSTQDNLHLGGDITIDNTRITSNKDQHTAVQNTILLRSILQIDNNTVISTSAQTVGDTKRELMPPKHICQSSELSRSNFGNATDAMQHNSRSSNAQKLQVGPVKGLMVPSAALLRAKHPQKPGN